MSLSLCYQKIIVEKQSFSLRNFSCVSCDWNSEITLKVFPLPVVPAFPECLSNAFGLLDHHFGDLETQLFCWGWSHRLYIFPVIRCTRFFCSAEKP